MRMKHELCGLDIEISDENHRICWLTIERPDFLREFVKDIWNAIGGIDSNLYITEGQDNLNLGKKAVFVTNPFDININDKKILSKVYQDMSAVCLNEEYEQLTEINREIVTLLDTINDKLPYMLQFNLDIDPMMLFKGYNVAIDEEEQGMLENLISYIRLSHQILGIQLFIFFHLCDFLDEKEMKAFIEMMTYEHVTILLIEASSRLAIEGIRYYIVDKDECLIEY